MKSITVRDEGFNIDDINTETWSSAVGISWEKFTFDCFDRFLDKDRIYIDIGAWIGPTALYGARKSKQCIAIEPDPVALHVLILNIRHNPDLHNKIAIFPGCLHVYDGHCDIYNNAQFGDSMSSTLLEGGEAKKRVTCLTWKSLVDRWSLTDCGMVKMDVEGMETPLVAAMLPDLERWKTPLHLSLHPFMWKDRKEEEKKIVSLVQQFPYIYDESGLVDVHTFAERMSQKKVYDVCCAWEGW